MVSNKVSVIVPVYNSASYLHRCIDSIVNQTYSNIELILVNDGSTDESAEICKAASNTDSRILVVNQKNRGVSAARNRGLDCATGEYICFVDSDDYVAERYVESMLCSILATESEMVISGRRQIKLDGNSNSTMQPNLLMIGSDIRQIFADKRFDYVRGGPCCKLYKREIIGENIRFPLGVHYLEDAIFVLSYMLCCDTISSINESNYCYELHQGSLVFSVHDYDSEHYGYTLFKKLAELFRENYQLSKNEVQWFDDNLAFLLYREGKTMKAMNSKQELFRAMNMFDWEEYRRLKKGRGFSDMVRRMMSKCMIGRRLLIKRQII